MRVGCMEAVPYRNLVHCWDSYPLIGSVWSGGQGTGEGNLDPRTAYREDCLMVAAIIVLLAVPVCLLALRIKRSLFF